MINLVYIQIISTINTSVDMYKIITKSEYSDYILEQKILHLFKIVEFLQEKLAK